MKIALIVTYLYVSAFLAAYSYESGQTRCRDSAPWVYVSIGLLWPVQGASMILDWLTATPLTTWCKTEGKQ